MRHDKGCKQSCGGGGGGAWGQVDRDPTHTREGNYLLEWKAMQTQPLKKMVQAIMKATYNKV